MDSLGLDLDRKVIALYGLPGSGKSYSIVKLVKDMAEQGHNVAIADRDRGLADEFKEQGFTSDPDNLDYFLIDEWEKLRQFRDHCLSVLGEGDWCVIEGMHKIWRFARADFIEASYGMTEDEFMEMKRHEAQTQIEDFFASNPGIDRESEEGVKELRRIRNKVLQFEGLDGRTEWPKITTKYMAAIEPLFISGKFNILTTTSAKRLDKDGLENEPEYMGVFFKPEGQKELVGMHSTLARMYLKDGVHYWSTDLKDASKDRGNPLFSDIPFSDIGFVQTYLDELEEAKSKLKGKK